MAQSQPASSPPAAASVHAAHVIHLFLLLPIHTRRRDPLDRMLGLEYGDPTRETGAAMTKRLQHGRMGVTAWALLLGHAVLAWSTSLAGACRREARPS